MEISFFFRKLNFLGSRFAQQTEKVAPRWAPLNLCNKRPWPYLSQLVMHQCPLGRFCTPSYASTQLSIRGGLTQVAIETRWHKLKTGAEHQFNRKGQNKTNKKKKNNKREGKVSQRTPTIEAKVEGRKVLWCLPCLYPPDHASMLEFVCQPYLK